MLGNTGGYLAWRTLTPLPCWHLAWHQAPNARFIAGPLMVDWRFRFFQYTTSRTCQETSWWYRKWSIPPWCQSQMKVIDVYRDSLVKIRWNSPGGDCCRVGVVPRDTILRMSESWHLQWMWINSFSHMVQWKKQAPPKVVTTRKYRIILTVSIILGVEDSTHITEKSLGC